MAHLCKAASTIFMPIRSGCYRMSNGLSTSADDGPSMADGLCLTQPAVGDPLLPVEPLQFQGQVSERTGHSVLSLEDKSSAKPVTSADFSATVEQ
jgi:hypothetical protein